MQDNLGFLLTGLSFPISIYNEGMLLGIKNIVFKCGINHVLLRHPQKVLYHEISKSTYPYFNFGNFDVFSYRLELNVSECLIASSLIKNFYLKLFDHISKKIINNQFKVIFPDNCFSHLTVFYDLTNLSITTKFIKAEEAHYVTTALTNSVE